MTRIDLKLHPDYPVLVVFDKFTSQGTENLLIFLAWRKSHIHVVMVAALCTDRLQPLDISVDKLVKVFMWQQVYNWYAEQPANISPRQDRYHSSWFTCTTECCEVTGSIVDDSIPKAIWSPSLVLYRLAIKELALWIALLANPTTNSTDVPFTCA